MKTSVTRERKQGSWTMLVLSAIAMTAAMSLLGGCGGSDSAVQSRSESSTFQSVDYSGMADPTKTAAVAAPAPAGNNTGGN